MKHVVLAVGLGIAGVLVFVQPAWAAASVAPPIPVGVAPNEVTFSPDGTVAYSANSGSNDISVIDVASGTTVGLPIPVDAQPVSIAFVPNGSAAYVASNGGTVSVIDTASALVTDTIAIAGASFIEITPDGATAYVASFGTNTVVPLDVVTGVAGTPIPVGSGPTGLAISPDGSRLYVANTWDGTVSAIDIATNTVITQIAVGPRPFQLTVSPDNSEV